MLHFVNMVKYRFVYLFYVYISRGCFRCFTLLTWWNTFSWEKWWNQFCFFFLLSRVLMGSFPMLGPTSQWEKSLGRVKINVGKKLHFESLEKIDMLVFYEPSFLTTEPPKKISHTFQRQKKYWAKRFQNQYLHVWNMTIICTSTCTIRKRCLKRNRLCSCVNGIIIWSGSVLPLLDV